MSKSKRWTDEPGITLDGATEADAWTKPRWNKQKFTDQPESAQTQWKKPNTPKEHEPCHCSQ